MSTRYHAVGLRLDDERYDRIGRLAYHLRTSKATAAKIIVERYLDSVVIPNTAGPRIDDLLTLPGMDLANQEIQE